MIHITLPDGRWLDLRPLVQDDDELFEMAWGSIDDMCTLAGFAKFAAVLEEDHQDGQASSTRGDG